MHSQRAWSASTYPFNPNSQQLQRPAERIIWPCIQSDYYPCSQTNCYPCSQPTVHPRVQTHHLPAPAKEPFTRIQTDCYPHSQRTLTRIGTGLLPTYKQIVTRVSQEVLTRVRVCNQPAVTRIVIRCLICVSRQPNHKPAPTKPGPGGIQQPLPVGTMPNFPLS